MPGLGASGRRTTGRRRSDITAQNSPVDFERDLIRERKGEGHKRAMANGVKFGRKPAVAARVLQRLDALAAKHLPAPTETPMLIDITPAKDTVND